MEELWLPLKNFETTHEISSFGRFRSKIKGNYRILTAYHVTKRGYLEIVLWKDKKNHSVSVHRALALTFLPNDAGLPEVDHINGLKLDNSLGNLQWVSPSYNSQKGTKSAGLREKRQPKAVCCLSGATTLFSSVREAAKAFSGNSSEVSWAALNNLRYKGHTWSY